MSDTVRAAIVQTAWTGDKDSMSELHEGHVREAAAQGVPVRCFQELFYGPYSCQVQDAQYHDYAEAIPDGTYLGKYRKTHIPQDRRPDMYGPLREA